MRKHRPANPRPKCPTPWKQSYRDHIAAKLGLSEIQRKGKQGHEERRAYHCPCGKFHLTSKPKTRS